MVCTNQLLAARLGRIRVDSNKSAGHANDQGENSRRDVAEDGICFGGSLVRFLICVYSGKISWEIVAIL